MAGRGLAEERQRHSSLKMRANFKLLLADGDTNFYPAVQCST
jgi:hypothetical protein